MLPSARHIPGCGQTWQCGLRAGHLGLGSRRNSRAISNPSPGDGRVCGAGQGWRLLSQPFLSQVTMTKPCAPIVTFGIKHSDYMTPLVVDVD